MVPELLRQLARLNKSLEEVGEALREAESGEGERSEADSDSHIPNRDRTTGFFLVCVH